MDDIIQSNAYIYIYIYTCIHMDDIPLFYSPPVRFGAEVWGSRFRLSGLRHGPWSLAPKALGLGGRGFGV